MDFLLIGFAMYDKLICFSIGTVCVCARTRTKVCSFFIFLGFCSTLILLVETNFLKDFVVLCCQWL